MQYNTIKFRPNILEAGSMNPLRTFARQATHNFLRPYSQKMSQSTTDVIIKTYPQGTVEVAQYRDLQRINDLVYAAYHPYLTRLNGKSPAPMTANYDSLIATRKLFILRTTSTTTISTPNPIIGCISLHLTPATHTLEINNVAIDPSAQGQGYGKLLMKFSEDLAGMVGAEKLELYTNVKMVENIGLYGKIGYVEVGRWEVDGFERVFMRKEMSEVVDGDGEGVDVDVGMVERLKRDLVGAGEEGDMGALGDAGGDDAGGDDAEVDGEQVIQLRAQLGDLSKSHTREEGRWSGVGL
ncbi:acyl-CoA N-acyltransferase [Aureobasidium pullulans]|uniref:Acyl-CoA N-acyltransferase n=1 Tax=Aureobasidium pullulans TaxID=5580 RepID=A0A4V4JUX7_AURPU|nr:acyl-CoA N-acyltransferase [Aureobasidium pullulans]